jgi:UTP:GlnB (protein PII) uridylyltransferase
MQGATHPPTQALVLPQEPAQRGAAIKAFCAAGQQAWQAAHRSGTPAPVVARGLADLMEMAAVSLFTAGRQSLPTTAPPVALVALGGLGRREMAPHSDLDLVVVSPHPKHPDVAALADALFYPLWDARLEVGHAVRSPEEFASLARDDETARTAAIDWRPLCGDREVQEDLRQRLGAVLRAGATQRYATEALRTWIEAGNPGYVYELQPNIKEGPGGLRELHRLWWLTKLLFKIKGWKDLLALGLTDAHGLSSLLAGHEGLLGMRLAMHFTAGRRQDVLRFEVQDEVADYLQVPPGPGARLPSDNLLEQFFRHAKALRGASTRVLEHSLETVAPHRHMGQVQALEGFHLYRGALTLQRPDQFEHAPRDLLRIFAVAQKHRVRLYVHARSRIVQEAPRLRPLALAGDLELSRCLLTLLSGVPWDSQEAAEAGELPSPGASTQAPGRPSQVASSQESGPPSPGATAQASGPPGGVAATPAPGRPIQVATAQSLGASSQGAVTQLHGTPRMPRPPAGTDAGETLEQLYELGVLEALLPEFAGVVGLAQRDLYHVHTVDAHLICCAQCTLRLLAGQHPEAPANMAALAAKVRRPHVLVMAALMHDIGKGFGHGHSERGAQMAQQACSRLQMQPDDTADVVWLVLEHLTLFRLSQRRDLEDRSLIERLAESVGTVERLDYLMLLSYTDAFTTGPKAWSDWKGDLLKDLYLRTRAALQGGVAEQKLLTRQQQRLEALQALRPASTHEIATWAARLVPRHLLSHAPAALLQQFDATLAAAQTGAACTVLPEGRPGGWALVLVGPDRPGLLAALTGVLAAWGIGVDAAAISGTTDGLAIDTFLLRDSPRSVFTDAQRCDALCVEMGAVLRGQSTYAARLTERRRAVGGAKTAAPPTRVIYDMEAQSTASVVDVYATDRPGFLHDVTEAIFLAGASIVLARVTTEGERAIDAFYLVDARTRRPLDAELREAVAQAIKTAAQPRTG